MIFLTLGIVSFTTTMTISTDVNQYAICDDTVHGDKEYIYFYTPSYSVDKVYLGITEEDYRDSMASFGLRQGTVLDTTPDELVCYDKAVVALGDHFMERYDSDYARATAVTFFIQSAIRYTDDLVLYGADEFWARPLETVYHQKGDCEDTAVLMCSICRYMGIKAILLERPTHIGVAVCVDASGHYYEYDGEKYYSCDFSSTLPAYRIGEHMRDDMRVVGIDESHYMYYFYSAFKTIGDRVEYEVSRW